ncbi:unnamed protein product, partial [Nesidiocoris tenuis]
MSKSVSKKKSSSKISRSEKIGFSVRGRARGSARGSAAREEEGGEQQLKVHEREDGSSW